MNTQPRVSIIIPVWNNPKQLRACLESLVAQTFQAFDVMIVDDGSDTPVQSFFEKSEWLFPVAWYRLPKNAGAPTARNEGFRHAQGTFVLFLDADIVLLPSALSRMLQALDVHSDADFAYASYRFGWKHFPLHEFDPIALRDHNYIHTSSLMRREAFPGFDPFLKRFQDWDVWLTMAEQGKKGVWIPEELFTITTGGTMSRWMPSFVHRIPWERIGYVPRELRRYRHAKELLLKKHHLPPYEA